MTLVAVPSPCLGSGSKDPGNYFGTISELDGADVERLREVLETLGERCSRLEKKCDAGEEFYRMVAGNLNLASSPVHLVYVDDRGRVRSNLILHDHRVTPFLYGQSNVWVLVFSEKPVDLEARLTTRWRQGASIADDLKTVFVTEGRRTQEARDAWGDQKPLRLDMLSGEEADRDLWYGAVRFFVEPLAVYQISVVPVEQEVDSGLEFIEARANFSNSLDRSLDLGLGLGATMGLDPGDEEALAGVQVGSASLNLYLMMDIYIVKPVVLAPMTHSIWGRYRPSIGIAVGTNLTFWDSRELNVGVSFGHLFGRHGLVLGVNLVNPASGDDQDRLVRPFVAGMFRF